MALIVTIIRVLESIDQLIVLPLDFFMVKNEDKLGVLEFTILLNGKLVPLKIFRCCQICLVGIV
jgi:hypothetical protein